MAATYFGARKGIQALEDELNELEKGEPTPDGEAELHDNPEPDIDETVESFITPKTKKAADEPPAPSGDEDTFKKRYGDLRRHSQKREEELKSQIKELEERIDSVATAASTGSNEPPTDPAEVKEWVSKYPQVAKIIAALAEDQAKKLYGRDVEGLKKLSQEKQEQENVRKIYKKHEDFDEIKDSNEFHDWAENQSRSIQNIIYKSKDADDIIGVLNLYKASTGSRDNPEKDAARPISKASKSSPTEKDGKKRYYESAVESMSAREYEKQEKDIELAIREGRFVYDISAPQR